MRINWYLPIIVLFFIFLLLPLTQQLTGVLPVKPLGGDELEVKEPEFHLKSWFNKEFQEDVETWYIASIGLRPWMIRTANQIRLSLFGQINQGRGTKVVLGKEDVLFENIYIEEYNNPPQRTDDYLDGYVWGVSRLQELLELHNIVFLLVLAPSKAEIYPEYLSEETKRPGREDRKSHYQRILPLLDKHKINYIDGHKLFKDWKEQGAPWLFARGGTHWNYYGAGKIVQLMLDNISEKSGQDFDNIETNSFTTDSFPYGTDNDLESLLNRWFSGGTNQEQIHPVYSRHETGKRPNILLIGDSFAFTLVHIFERQELVESIDLLYYSRRRFSWPSGINERINVSGLDFQKDMLDKDVVIIELTEQKLPKFGFGILGSAVRAIEAIDAAKSPEVKIK